MTRRRPGMSSCSRWRMRTSGFRAPGAWSATCTASTTARPYGKRTTRTCPRSRGTTPNSRRTSRSTASTRRSPPRPDSPGSAVPSEESWPTSCATFALAAPNCRPRTRHASAKSSRTFQRCRRSSPRTCSMPPTRPRSPCRPQARSRAFPRMCLPPPARRRRRTERREAAHLLGYANHAEVSLVPKMAQSPVEVLAFLDDLAQKAMPFARRDWSELGEFAKRELGLDRLEACDVAFASEKLREKRYAFSDQEVKQYFPEHKVLEGMFRVVEAIYGIRIEPDRAETWHPDVRFFRIVGPSGAPGSAPGGETPSSLGRFYLDPYARETKRGGAWMDEAISRRLGSGGVQAPVAYLVCNFSPPVGGKPALLTHDDVITLFHEFGHGLHHLLSRVDYLGASGIHGVEWDAVELPSQFMENFCWEWDVLRHMTAHVDTGGPLPRPLFDKMVAAKNFQSGMQMVRQLEFSLFDMHLHYHFDPDA